MLLLRLWDPKYLGLCCASSCRSSRQSTGRCMLFGRAARCTCPFAKVPAPHPLLDSPQLARSWPVHARPADRRIELVLLLLRVLYGW